MLNDCCVNLNGSVRLPASAAAGRLDHGGSWKGLAPHARCGVRAASKGGSCGAGWAGTATEAIGGSRGGGKRRGGRECRRGGAAPIPSIKDDDRTEGSGGNRGGGGSDMAAGLRGESQTNKPPSQAHRKATAAGKQGLMRTKPGGTVRTTSTVCNLGHAIAQAQMCSQVAASRTYMYNAARSRHLLSNIPVQHPPLPRAALVEAQADGCAPSRSARQRAPGARCSEVCMRPPNTARVTLPTAYVAMLRAQQARRSHAYCPPPAPPPCV